MGELGVSATGCLIDSPWHNALRLGLLRVGEGDREGEGAMEKKIF